MQTLVLLITGINAASYGLQWSDIGFDMGKLSITCGVENTKMHGLWIKPPKLNTAAARSLWPQAQSK
jgi:hypothetical protein